MLFLKVSVLHKTYLSKPLTVLPTTVMANVETIEKVHLTEKEIILPALHS